MKRLFLIATAAATLTCGAALADCAAEIEALSGGGIVQDGSHAPLGASPDIATSPSDVAAQEEGKAPAAAESANASDARTAAIDRAKTAAAAGNEAECLAAVEEARGM